MQLYLAYICKNKVTTQVCLLIDILTVTLKVIIQKLIRNSLALEKARMFAG